MKLPYLENAYVPKAKIVEYLLNLEHERGGKEKAAFFMRFGFTIDQWQVLANALIHHAAAHEIADIVAKPTHTNYVVEGTLDSPDDRHPQIRTVWAIDRDSITPRFVTAYPL